ncbi:PHP domain-containing protein [Streptomyces cellostaticus]|uniref:PHP domain-containing protein n=1 Tax=Streptomyces cellostaticus TaxID=67285 RepID=UPI00202761D6|nr:PHP domain-containing protein [Streptomyces cellostaticus]
MAPVDLHTHTSVSDGRLGPEQLIAAAAESGVRVLVITDHSAVTWSKALVRRAAALGVSLPFPGMELSTVHEGERYHVLVYGSGCLDPGFAVYASRPNQVKNERIGRALDVLRTEHRGIPDLPAVLRGRLPDGSQLHPHKRLLSRTDTCNVLASFLDRGVEDTRVLLSAALREVDRRDPILGSHENTYLPTAETIERAVEAGCLPVLAHPLWRLPDEDSDRSRLERDLRLFRRLGLRGAEVASYHHPRPGADPRLVALLPDLGLERSGGSDFHGNGKSWLGRYGLTSAEFDRLARLMPRNGSETKQSGTLV